MTSFPNLMLLLLQFFTFVSISTIPNSISTPTYLNSVCPNATSTINNTFNINLKTLLHSLPSKASTTHFYATSIRNLTRNAVYGLYLCRADINATTCHDCVTAAATIDLPKTYCPNSKVAVIWYDECMVRYSNQSLFGKMDLTPTRSLMNSQNYDGNQTLFYDVMRTLVNRLVAETANNLSGLKFSTGMMSVTISTTLYAVEQCTPDLMPGDCRRCLRTAIDQLPLKLGGRVFTPSCLVDYQIYKQFYTDAEEDIYIPDVPCAPSIYC